MYKYINIASQTTLLRSVLYKYTIFSCTDENDSHGHWQKYAVPFKRNKYFNMKLAG